MIFFDIDNTLLDNSTAAHKAAQAFYDRHENMIGRGINSFIIGNP